MVKFAETDELCSQLSRLPSPEPEKSPSISGETNRYVANGNKTLNKQDLYPTNYYTNWAGSGSKVHLNGDAFVFTETEV